MKLLNTPKTCHEIGVCQRTTPQCRRACHIMSTDKEDPPIGYEAASVFWHEPTQRQEQQDAEPDCWEYISRWLMVLAGVVGMLVLLVGIAASLAYPGTILYWSF